jgi:biotin carboxyl carrier protein
MKQFSFIINGSEYEVKINSVSDNTAEVEVNGYNYSVQTAQPLEPVTKTPKLVVPEAVPSTDITPSEKKTSAPVERPKTSGGAGSIKSPLPGIILNIFVSEGQSVAKGDKLCCLEAMKMENIINSDKNGTIKAIHIAKGKTVMEGDVMFEIG